MLVGIAALELEGACWVEEDPALEENPELEDPWSEENCILLLDAAVLAEGACCVEEPVLE